MVGWDHMLLRSLRPWFVGQHDLWKLKRLMGSSSLCNRGGFSKGTVCL